MLIKKEWVVSMTGKKVGELCGHPCNHTPGAVMSIFNIITLITWALLKTAHKIVNKTEKKQPTVMTRLQ